MKNISNSLIKILLKTIIYLFCARFFVSNVIQLCVEFLRFETNVLIGYSVPKHIQYPAFTICGCCLQKQVRHHETPRKTFHNEYELLKNYSVLDIFNRFTYESRKLVPNCHLIANEINISGENVVLESIHQGRKCFTYFSLLPDENRDETFSLLNINKRFLRCVHFDIKINPMGSPDELFNADILFGLHSPHILPSMLDTEFIRLQPGMSYTVQFKQILTQLKPWPFRTRCKWYSHRQMPRSQSECINMCILEETIQMQNSSQNACLNYYAVATRSMIRQIETKRQKFSETSIKFCARRSYLDYYRYMLARRKCYAHCDRDCQEEYYTRTIDISVDDDDSPIARISITANHDMVQTIKHETQMNIFEFVGYLGGHAHIWLGLSVIQFYDVIVKLYFKISYYWQRFLTHLNRRNLFCK